MVSDSRTSLRPHQFRPLNEPQRVGVTCDKRGAPTSVWLNRRAHRVRAIRDRWRIDDEWWRNPIRRLYYLVELANDTLLILYQDLESETWYRQKETVEVPHRNQYVR